MDGITEKYILVGNKKIHYYESENHHPPVLFLHAWPSSALMWDRIIELLSGKYHIIAPDLPGFGLSEPLDETHSIRNYVEFVHEFASAVGLSSFHLVGYSFGSILAVSYALRYTNMVKSLVLGALPVYHGDFIPTQAFLVDWLLTRFPVLLNVINTYNKSLYKKKEYPLTHPYVNKYVSPHRFEKYYDTMARYDNKAAIDVLHELVNIDMRRKLRQLRKKTLLVVTDHDERVTLKQAEALKRRIRNSHLVTIRNGDHALPAEHPRELAAIIDEFVQSNVS